jgi:hypothetical protein
MNLTEVREVIRQTIAEAMEKGSLPKSGGKLVHLKKELQGLKKMKEALGQYQIAEGGDQSSSFVAEYAHMQKFVNELEKIKAAHSKLAEMLDSQISEVEGKVSSETEKIKEMMGLIEKAKKPAAKKNDKKAAKKDDKKEEPKEEKPKADGKKKAKELDENYINETEDSYVKYRNPQIMAQAIADEFGDELKALPSKERQKLALTYAYRKFLESGHPKAKIIAQNLVGGYADEDWPSDYISTLYDILGRDLGEARYNVSPDAIPAQDLKKGDILGSGEKVVSVSAGAKTPSGKVEVTLEKDGKERTSLWGKNTKVTVKK